MPDLKEGVKSQDSPTEEEVEEQDSGNPEEPQSQQTTEEPQEQTEQSESPPQTASQPGIQTDNVLDSRGVPLVNRVEELYRKFGDVTNKIDSLVNHQSSAPKTETRPLSQYSIEQLEIAAQRDPSLRPYIEDEKQKRTEDNIIKRVREERESEVRQNEYKSQTNQSWNYISQTYPEAFTPDKRNLDLNSSLVQRANQIYSADPVFKEKGYGWQLAFDAAYGQISREKGSRSVGRTRRQQKSSLPSSTSQSGGVTPPTRIPPAQASEKMVKDLLERRQQFRSGSREYIDLTTEIYKLRGLISNA